MQWASGATGMISEADITPATDVPKLSDIKQGVTQRPELLGETVVLKLNGGLGTSMGLVSSLSHRSPRTLTAW